MGIRFILAVALFIVPLVNAQDVQFVDQLDEIVPRLLDEYSVPGAAIALIENGEIIAMQGYGYADVQNGTPVTENTQFRLGSISKPFTAWALLKLAEDGLVNLDLPADTYLERWEIPSGSFDASRVTIRRLLSHTAGTSVEYFDDYGPTETVPELVDLVSGADRDHHRVELVKPPGLQWLYSDGGYAILEMIVEDVTGSTFEEYVSEKILDGLKISSTGYSASRQLATSYNSVGTRLVEEQYASKAASGLYSTLSDMAAFAAMNLGATASDDFKTDVISEESLLLAQTPAPDTRGGYGLGYSTRLTLAGDAVVGHGAAAAGWHSNFAVLPARGQGIVILTNSSSGGNVTTLVRCSWYQAIIGAMPAGACKTDIAARIVKPLMDEGVEEAIRQFRSLVSRTGEYNVDEWQLNGLGYDLLASGRIDDAVRIFEVNVEFFTSHANPHDSLAEAYMLQGNTEGARTHFQRSLEIDPSNDNARDKLLKLGS
ncbi:MAG: serine hydrolase [Rhodothermales bacterium]|nr:serine hydrolase [Rhodothermales bacterium]